MEKHVSLTPVECRIFFLCVLLVVSIFPSIAQQPLLRETQGARSQIAAQMFEKRCKAAGEKIYRTAVGVDGILLMRIRQKRNFADQFALDDPYGRDLIGNGYIESFLTGAFQAAVSGTPVLGAPPRLGYRYVEAIDPKDGKLYRYTGKIKDVTHKSSKWHGGNGKEFTTKDFVIDRVVVTGPTPQYGVTYDDISTHEDREYWIAGSSLRVIDLKSNEVIAERIGYMMDPGQGNRSGGRSPWLLAADHACPAFHRNPLRPIGNGSEAQIYQTLDFVEKVLKQKTEK